MRDIVWWVRDDDGTFATERATLTETGDGWRFAGVVAGYWEGRPVDARYHVTVDREWRTRSATLTARTDGAERTLRVEVDEHGSWLVDGAPDPSLTVCVDIDLGCTPITNTLPIRRVPLAPGEAAGFTMALVRFPESTVVPQRQRYERLDERRYRFESLDDRDEATFTATLTVDDDGLVRTYGSLWASIDAEGRVVAAS